MANARVRGGVRFGHTAHIHTVPNTDVCVEHMDTIQVSMNEGQCAENTQVCCIEDYEQKRVIWDAACASPAVILVSFRAICCLVSGVSGRGQTFPCGLAPSERFGCLAGRADSNPCTTQGPSFSSL